MAVMSAVGAVGSKMAYGDMCTNADKTLELLKKTLHVETSSTMSSRYEPAGLDALKLFQSSISYEIDNENIVHVVEKSVADKQISIPIEAQQYLVSGIDDFVEYGRRNKPMSTHNIITSYANGSGSITLLQMLFRPIKDDPTGMIFKKDFFTCQFKPSRPYVVITETRKDLLHNRTEQRIEYLDATLRPEHLEMIAHASLPFVMNTMQLGLLEN